MSPSTNPYAEIDAAQEARRKAPRQTTDDPYRKFDPPTATSTAQPNNPALAQGAGQVYAQNIAQGATLGAMPRLQADLFDPFNRGALGLYRWIHGSDNDVVRANDAKPVMTAEDYGDAVRAGQEAHPYAAAAGQITGAAIPAIASAPAFAGIGGTGLAGQALRGAAQGAALSTVETAGDVSSGANLDPIDVGLRFATGGGLGAAGPVINKLVSPLFSGAARVSGLSSQPLSEAAQDATLAAARQAEGFGLKPTLPQAMRLGGQTEEALPVEGLYRQLRGGAGEGVLKPAAVRAEEALASARAGPTPGTPFYEAANKDVLPSFPQSAGIREAEGRIQASEPLMEAIRRRLGLGPTDTVNPASVAFRRAVRDELDALERGGGAAGRVYGEDAAATQRALKAGSESYRQGAETHADFKRAVEELARRAPPASSPADPFSRFMRLLRALPVAGPSIRTGAEALSSIGSRRAAERLLDPASVRLIGQEMPWDHPIGLLSATTAPVETASQQDRRREVRSRRRPAP